MEELKEELKEELEKRIVAMIEEAIEPKKEHIWSTLDISRDETLICDECNKSVHSQEVHIGVYTIDPEVICEECWKRKAKKEGL